MRTSYIASRFVQLSACLLALNASAQTQAEEATPLLHGKAAITVTTADILARAGDYPLSQRSELLGNAALVQQAADNIYIRRVMASQAEAAQLQQSPRVQALLQLAKEQVMSDAWIAHSIEVTSEQTAAIEAYARSAYTVNAQKRFAQPQQWQARHILIKVDDTASEDQARTQAQEILQKLQKGADFAELAKAHSQDPGSAARGGELSPFGAGKMVQPFEEAVAQMKPGQLSELVQSQFGFHIIELLEHTPARVQPYEEVADLLRDEAKYTLINERRQKDIDEIRSTGQLDEKALEAFVQKHR